MFDLDSLNPQQRDAVETVRGPVLILAGAGTGKTRVITCRIAHMIQRGIPPGKILAVTFTNKAAREMVERVNGMIPRRPARDDGEKPERPTVCTFHSLCVRILRQHIERLGYTRNFVIYSESEQLGAIRKILSQIQGEKVDPGAVLGMLSRYRNGGTRAAAFADNNVAALAEHVRKKYESALRACNAVDFDDLLLLVLRLFKEFPDVLEACRARFRFIMVDEYQDTNAVQFELVNHLASEHRNLCVVGDDDQSIYGWRGAEVANLLDLEKHFPEVKVIKLEQNYRSTNIILRAANAVIKNNARRRGKQLWSAKGDGAKLALCAFDTDEDEARTVVEEIEFQRAARRVPWANHAILFRTNLQSRPIETALRKAGVRYHLIGGQSFFDRREVKDLLAYLRVLLNPHDDVSLLRIANTPPRGLSDVTMERLLAASTERQCSVFTTMRHTDVLGGFQARAREAVTGFAHWLESHSAALHGEADFAVGDWADALLKETGYYDDLRKSERETEAGEARANCCRRSARRAARARSRRSESKAFSRKSPSTPSAPRRRNPPVRPSRSSRCTRARGWSFRTSTSSASRTVCCRTRARRLRARSTRSADCFTSPSRARRRACASAIAPGARNTARWFRAIPRPSSRSCRRSSSRTGLRRRRSL